MGDEITGLPAGATLRPIAPSIEGLPEGATLRPIQSESPARGSWAWFGGSNNESQNSALDTQLHKAYDDRPLWRKVLGLQPENLSPELQQHYDQTIQQAKQGAGERLKDTFASYGEGAVSGLKAAPFFALGPAGGAIADAVGGGAAGVLANAATQGVGAAALSKVEGSSNKGAAVSGVLGAAGPLAEAALPVAARVLRKGAQENYESLINPTKNSTKFDTEKIMPQLLEERPFAATRAGLQQKAEANANEVGQQIEQTVSGMKGSMPTKPVIDGLQSLKQSYQVNGVSLRPEVDAAIDNMSGILKNLGPDISLQDAVKARRILDTAVAEVKGYSGANIADASVAAIRREAANSFRSELAKQSPDLAALNAKFSFWNTLADVMDATKLRKVGQSTPLGTQLQTMGGIIAGGAKEGIKGAGGLGTAAYLVNKAVRSPLWKTVSANGKLALSDALASGDTELVTDVLTKLGAAGAAQH